MTTPNRTFMQKADMEVADLMNDGGYLDDERANRFVVDMVEEANLLPLLEVKAIKSHTQVIDKVGISGWVLKPGTSGQALAAADRIKPTTAQTTLTTTLMKGEINLPDEVLEDNIEAGTFKATVTSMMQEHVAIDMDRVVCNGDTAGTTGTVLDLIDGLLKSATSHVVAAGTNVITKVYLKRAVKAMPQQYKRTKARQRFLTSDDAETDYRDYLADRATVLGDKFVEGDAPVKYANRAILPISVFPDNLGSGTDETNILLMDPKMARVGIWRKVKFESDRDIRSGEWIMVASLRWGFKYREEDAVVKVTGIQTQ